MFGVGRGGRVLERQRVGDGQRPPKPPNQIIKYSNNQIIYPQSRHVRQ